MSYENTECKIVIDWPEYLKYEKLRKKGVGFKEMDKMFWHAETYEEIYLEFINRKLYGNA